MALSEIQKQWLTQKIFYDSIMSIATGMDRNMMQLRDKLEWLNNVSSEDLDSITIPASAQTLLSNFRTALTSLITEYDSNMASIADQIRQL